MFYACYDCTDVICNFIVQMLLSIVLGTDVLMPVSYCLFLAQMLMCLIFGQDVVRPIFYFIFSSGMLNSKLSQMCGRLYFPIFLLSVGLFTLIYIDSLIVLAKLFVVFSPYYFEVFYRCFMATDVLMLEYW